MTCAAFSVQKLGSLSSTTVQAWVTKFDQHMQPHFIEMLFQLVLWHEFSVLTVVKPLRVMTPRTSWPSCTQGLALTSTDDLHRTNNYKFMTSIVKPFE